MKKRDYDAYRLFGKDIRTVKALWDYRYRYLYCWRKIVAHSYLTPVYKWILKGLRKHYHIEIPYSVILGEGFSMDHAYNITINSQAVLGKNVTMYKGSTIGANQRGVPKIGNAVYIGLNAVVVGNIQVGDDVLIAPNAYVNFDVPSHAVVVGNPGVIHHKEQATAGYLYNVVGDKGDG